MTDALFWLTLTALMGALLWMPYTLERIARVGLGDALGYAPRSSTAGFEQSDETPAIWAKRAFAAHRNLLESLPVFAALVLTASILKIDGGGVATASLIFFAARLAHFVIYLLGISFIRTLTFFVAFAAQIYIGYAIVAAL